MAEIGLSVVRAVAAVSVVALAVVGASASPADARKPFDVRVRSVGAPPAQVQPGATIAVRVVAARSGSGLRSARLSAVLSRDAKRSRDDVVLAAAGSLTALRRKAAVKRLAKLTVPRASKLGVFRLLVCVDRVRAKRRDRRRGNDCRVAGTVTVIGHPSPAFAQLRPSASVEALGGATTADSGGTGGGASAGTPTSIGFPRPADPLSVTAEFDHGAAVTQVVGDGGAVLEADGEDGAHFRLTIPAGAVAGETAITMTPVLALSGQPALGQLVAGARLEPEGLVLGRPAVLEITPPEPPPASLTGFQFHEDGEDVHRYPSRRSGGGATIVFDLPHFSSPSASTGADRAALDRHPPSRAAGQFEQEAARLLDEAALEGADVSTRLRDLSLAYFDGVVQPALTAASADLTQAPAAAAAAMAWVREAQLLGIADEPEVAARISRAIAAVHELLRRVVDASEAACRNHDLDMIATLVALEREAQLLGIEDANAAEKARKCATFAVDLNSRLSRDDSSGTWVYETQSLDVPIGIDGPTGSSPLTWLAFDGVHDDGIFCNAQDENGNAIHSAWHETDEGTIGSTVTARLDMTLKARMPGTPQPPGDREAVLILDTGSPKEIYRYTIDPPGACTATGTSEASVWENLFALAETGVTKAPPLTIVSGWETGSQALVLSRTFTSSATELQEETTIEVWHTPVP